MNTKTFWLVCLSILLFSACKKNDSNDIYSSKIVMDALKVTGNKVTISWSKLEKDSLSAYILIRVTDTNNISVEGNVTSIHIDKGTTSYTDTLPYSPYVQYYVEGIAYGSGSMQVIASNKEMYVRTDINFITMVPQDALYNDVNHTMYLYSSSGDIAAYDMLNKKVLKQISTNAAPGYCSLGDYNGKKELYVPRNDGWLFIYDAATLTQTDQINVGEGMSSVLTNNGILFITTVDQWGDGSIVTYDRASKTKISQAGDAYSSFGIRLIPGSNTDILAISGNDIYKFSFTATGVLNPQNTPQNYNSHPFLSQRAFEIFPDASAFITGAQGFIFNSSLTYVTSLPHGNTSLIGFCFDAANRLIFAASNLKTIQAYSMDNYLLTKTVNTNGYPVKIFYDNGSLISVSTSIPISNYGPTGTAYTFIEQF